MERNDKGTALKNLWDRWKYVALVVALGAALLLLPFGRERDGTAADAAAGSRTAETEEEAERTEARMETILARIAGVGELHLMLTADTGAESRLAQDTELSYSGDTAAPEDYQRSSKTVLSSRSGESGPVVTQTRCPTWRGALVVCQGGGDAEVKLAVTQAVAALTGLGSDRITVVKCQ